MSRAGASAGTGGLELLGARRSPGSAVVAVVLRSARWPYSCGLACSMQVLAYRFARAGGELVLAVDEPASRRALVADVWGLGVSLLPLALPLADELGHRDPVTGRADDGVGVLTPSGVWAATWDFGDPFGPAHPEQVLRALQDVEIPGTAPAPEARQQTFPAVPGDRAVCPPDDARRVLARALAGAERATALPDTLGATASELAARRLRTYVAAIDTIREVRSSTPRPGCTNGAIVQT